MSIYLGMSSTRTPERAVKGLLQGFLALLSTSSYRVGPNVIIVGAVAIPLSMRARLRSVLVDNPIHRGSGGGMAAAAAERARAGRMAEQPDPWRG